MLVTHSQPIRVVVADDHLITLQGFSHIFYFEKDISLVAAVTDGIQLVKAVDEHQPDVILTDLHMPHMDGPEACVKILRQNPAASILVCSMYDSEDLVRQLRGVGVKGYLIKGSSSGQEICTAIRILHQGGEYFSSSIRQRTNGFFRGESLGAGIGNPQKKFTAVEMQIIRLICEGRSAKEIADQLKMKERTVTAHKETIEQKMGVQYTVDIAVFAVKNWLLYEDAAAYRSIKNEEKL